MTITRRWILHRGPACMVFLRSAPCTVPPTQFFQHVGSKFRVAFPEIGALGPGIFRQQTHPVVLYAETRPEGQTALRDLHAGVIQDW